MPESMVKHVTQCCTDAHAVARLDELGVQFCELPVQRVAAQVQAAHSKPQHCGRLHRRRGGHGQRNWPSGTLCGCERTPLDRTAAGCGEIEVRTTSTQTVLLTQHQYAKRTSPALPHFGCFVAVFHDDLFANDHASAFIHPCM